MHLRRGRALPRTGLALGASGLAGALSRAWLNHQPRDAVLVPGRSEHVAAYGLVGMGRAARRAGPSLDD